MTKTHLDTLRTMVEGSRLIDYANSIDVDAIYAIFMVLNVCTKLIRRTCRCLLLRRHSILNFFKVRTRKTHELPRTMNDLRDSGKGKASMWSIRTYCRITKRHIYWSGSTSENRDTGLVNRTGYDGDPGDLDLTFKKIFRVFMILLIRSFEMN